jgi:hypothetical protein
MAATAAPPLDAELKIRVEWFKSRRLALSAATAPPRLAVLFTRRTSERRREESPERKMLPPVMAPFHFMRLRDCVGGSAQRHVMCTAQPAAD